MDIIQAINQRKSIGAFKSDPVTKEVLREIMEVGLLGILQRFVQFAARLISYY
jgi:hypothetical protein